MEIQEQVPPPVNIERDGAAEQWNDGLWLGVGCVLIQ
jgi:hypothetical protein